MFRLVKQGATEQLIVACTTSRFASGAKYTATAVTATFFKVNAGGTALEIDTTIGTNGVLTLTPDTGGKTGFHAALLDVSAVPARVYAIIYEATVDNVPGIALELLDLSAERKRVADYLDAALSGRPTLGQIEASTVLANEATLTAIKGTGWTTETLKAIKDYVDELETRLTVQRAINLDNLDVQVSSRSQLAAADVDAQLSAAHGIGSWESGGASGGLVLPVMQGRVYETTAVQQKEVLLVRGDTPRIVFDLGADYTGWTIKFGAKARPGDSAYVIAVKDGVWTTAAKGQGYVDLTSAETAQVARLYGEIELRKDTSRLTALRFLLRIMEDVID